MKKILLGCLLALGMTTTHAQVVTGQMLKSFIHLQRCCDMMIAQLHHCM